MSQILNSSCQASQYALTTSLLTLSHCRSPWTKKLFLGLSSTASCGLRQHRARQYRIKVGSYADIEAHPWQAAIFVKYYRVPGEHFLCGGILISSCWVLSAAHCFEEGWVEDLVLFGKSWLKKKKVWKMEASSISLTGRVKDLKKTFTPLGHSTVRNCS